MSQGNLIIRPITANLTHDTDTFGAMDPFVIAMMGDQKHRGKTHTDGGKHPKWNDTFVFSRTEEKSVFLEIRDEDDMSSNDLIGFAEVPITDLENTGRFSGWRTVYYKKKPAGQIMVEAELKGYPKQSQYPTFDNQNVNVQFQGGQQFNPNFQQGGQQQQQQQQQQQFNPNFQQGGQQGGQQGFVQFPNQGGQQQQFNPNFQQGGQQFNPNFQQGGQQQQFNPNFQQGGQQGGDFTSPEMNVKVVSSGGDGHHHHHHHHHHHDKKEEQQFIIEGDFKKIRKEFRNGVFYGVMQPNF